MNLLPPRVSDPPLFALLADILSARGPELNAELRLRLIERKLPWQNLIDVAEGFCVLPPLLWALIQRSLLFPVPTGSASKDGSQHPTIQLSGLYKAHLARRRHQREQLIGILHALNLASIKPLLLKGARYILAPLGAWCEARDMRDLDLLVRDEDAERAASTLATLGYKADTRPIPMDQHLPEMWLAGAPSVVELHTQALSFSARKILPTSEIWRRSQLSSNDGASFFVLPTEWQLLHCILNHQVADRCYAQHMLEMKSLWEFAMLASDVSAPGWKTITSHLMAMHQADVLGTSIAQAARLFYMPHPQGIEISSAARVHANMVFKNAAAPNWLRHCRRLFDQLRFGFGRETLAVRYGADKSLIGAMACHLRFLVRHYRGRTLLRLFGQSGAGS